VTPNTNQSLYAQIRARYPSLSERELVERICGRLLSEAEVEPPINVERLASLRGIVSIERREQPWAGVLEPRGANFVIGVRAADGYERQRFSICHEASHTFFPGFAERRQFRCNGDRTRLEQLCDFAATELLLPKRFFVARLAGARFDLDTVEDLANEYEASIEATTLRFADLWPEPTLMGVFRHCHKPAELGRESECEQQLRLSYSVASGAWPYARRFKSVNEQTPAGRAFAGELVAETGTLGELLAKDPGPLEIHARRYGNAGRVIMLARPARREA
jgi:hypothetical protein